MVMLHIVVSIITTWTQMITTENVIYVKARKSIYENYKTLYGGLMRVYNRVERVFGGGCVRGPEGEDKYGNIISHN